MYGCPQDPQKRRRGGPERFPKKYPIPAGRTKAQGKVYLQQLLAMLDQRWFIVHDTDPTYVSNNRRVHWVQILAEPAKCIRGLV